MPKSNVAQVLLHDNLSLQLLLDAELRHISGQERRVKRVMELHRNAFLAQQSIKQHQMRAMGITHLSFLPDAVAHAHIKIAEKNGIDVVKALPMHHRLQHRRLATSMGNRSDSSTSAVHSGNHLNDSRTSHLPFIIFAKRKSSSAFIQTGQVSEPALSKDSIRREKTISYMGEHHSKRKGYQSDDDVRFQKLKNILVKSDTPTDSFLKLSPSGLEVLQKYPPNRSLIQPKQVSGQNKKTELQDSLTRRNSSLQKRVSIVLDKEQSHRPCKPKGIFRPSTSSMSEFSEIPDSEFSTLSYESYDEE